MRGGKGGTELSCLSSSAPHAKRRFGGDCGVKTLIVSPIVCSQASAEIASVCFKSLEQQDQRNWPQQSLSGPSFPLRIGVQRGCQRVHDKTITRSGRDC
jgi:hypothetical protein